MGIKERREREKKQRRQQIVDAAKKVFSANGFNKATMGDIAREAEISPATIYLYFNNKEDLFASLSLEVLQYMLSRLELVDKKTVVNSHEKIMAIKEALFEVYEYNPFVLMNMFHLQSNESLKNLSPNLLSDIKKLAQKSFRLMSKIFEEGIKKGDFIKRQTIALSDIVWALFAGIVLWEESKRLIDSHKDYLRSTLEIGFEIFGRGIKECSEQC